MTDDRQVRESVAGVSVVEAARLLGISDNAVRLRIQRGSLTSERIGNRRLVYLSSETVTTESQPVPTDTATQSEPTDLIEQLQSENQFLRDELRAVREENRESQRELRVLIAQQSAQLIEMLGQVRALQAGPSESPESVSATEDDQDDGDADTTPQGVESGRWRRFWSFFAGDK